jgi:hypothetical protein
MDKKSVYCTAPWNGLTIRENGHVRTCCSGQKSLADLNVEWVDNIENSPILKEIQSAMLNGKPDLENCNSCIEQEKINGHSTLRNHYNTFYPEFDPHQISLKFIDVRWNNTCNLSCMYCSPLFSSTWNDKLKENGLRPVKPYQDELLFWILNRVSHVKEILLVGGEPLLMKQNYELLKVLPNDCQISIITNLSYDLKNLPCLPDLLKRPADKIMWNISAENTYKQFEYVRQGAKWNQLEENIKFLHQHWENTLTMNMVYSMFNALDLLEIIKVFKSLGLQKFNLLPINDNKGMVVSFMPQPIRQVASQILNQVVEYHTNSLHPEDKNLYPIQGIEQLSVHLENNNKSQLISRLEFQKQIQWYDQWSTVHFQELWPNVIALTDQHLI